MILPCMLNVSKNLFDNMQSRFSDLFKVSIALLVTLLFKFNVSVVGISLLGNLIELWRDEIFQVIFKNEKHNV